jgi:lipopolysaccharide export system protein LptC
MTESRTGRSEKPPPRENLRTPASYRALQWRISTREALNNAWRYSVFVKFMKGALPIAALGLAVVVFVYALQPRDTNQMALTFERLGQVEGDLAMLKPRLTGTDDSGQPFVVTAATAVQEARGSDVVRLEGVVADINLKDGTALHLTANQGVVDTKTHRLDVTGVRLTSADGYDARTAAASADLRAGTFHGESPIEAEGKFGRITAQRFALNTGTKKLQFMGNVRMLLYGGNNSPFRRTPE